MAIMAIMAERPELETPLMLRRPAVADAEAIADNHLASFAATYDFALAHTEPEIRGWIPSHVIGELVAWVATEDDAIVGYIAFSPTTAVQLEVKPGRTGEGTGSRLLEQAKAQRPDRLELWRFQVNDGARRFYRRHGFEEVEFGDGDGNKEGQPDLRFAWRPAPNGALG